MSNEVLEGNSELILCAAIWYADGKQYEHQPKNIASGIVVCGRRHHNCIVTKSQMNIPKGTPSVQGFITSKDRFLDRQEAMELAKESGQVTKQQSFEELYSEDLY